MIVLALWLATLPGGGEPIDPDRYVPPGHPATWWQWAMSAPALLVLVAAAIILAASAGDEWDGWDDA